MRLQMEPAQRSRRGVGRVENVTETREGIFRVDIDALMKGEPAVMKIRDGVYRIDLSTKSHLL